MKAGVVLVLVLEGCVDTLAPEVGISAAEALCNEDSAPLQPVSFVAEISPILRASCDRCHLPGGAGQMASGLDLSTYDSLRAGGLRSVRSIVVEGEPCASVLVKKLGPAPPFGSRMPRDSDPLLEPQLHLIHDWIAEGARDH
ncbi:MAG: hypothetical protein JWP01_1268 [Myxococcales bacterium]|nr:hypothetical protein [Myxococcales bacterium]